MNKYFPKIKGGKIMENIVFKDCQYRFSENDELYCKNKTGSDTNCDNCKENIHLNCDNYSAKKDFCLKFSGTVLVK